MTTQSTAGTSPSWPVVSIATAHALLTQPGSPFEMEEILIRGVPTRVWKNAPPTMREVLLASWAGYGGREFVVHEDERATYDGFRRATLAIAHKLIELGVTKGDRVAIAMRNLPEWPVAYFGALLAGAIATPLNAWWTGPELEYGLSDSGAKVALVDGERLERLADHLHGLPGLEHILVCRATTFVADARISLWENVTGPVNAWSGLPDRPVPDIALHPEDDATIFYTSGTTGKPKGALGTHRNAVSALIAQGLSPARSFVRRGERPPLPSPQDPQRVNLLSIPLFHTTGCHAGLAGVIATGAKVIMQRRWDPEAAMALIEREKITHAGGVPTIAVQLLEHPARSRYDLSSLQSISYGGAPASPELPRRIKEAFPASLPGTGWGMTETCATFTHHQAEDYVARPDSCGVPLPVCDVRIVGSNGEDLPIGEVGELWAKGPNIVKGYWNKPEATAETFVDGWLKTGDLARVDEEGFVYIVDRAKDMVIRGGENIYCVEVESALYEHPAVIDAAVVAKPHPALGEEPAAVVTLKANHAVTEAELQTFLKPRLAAFKIPVQILFSADLLPRNANGKIIKPELRKLFQ